MTDKPESLLQFWAEHADVDKPVPNGTAALVRVISDYLAKHLPPPTVAGEKPVECLHSRTKDAWTVADDMRTVTCLDCGKVLRRYANIWPAPTVAPESAGGGCAHVGPFETHTRTGTTETFVLCRGCGAPCPPSPQITEAMVRAARIAFWKLYQPMKLNDNPAMRAALQAANIQMSAEIGQLKPNPILSRLEALAEAMCSGPGLTPSFVAERLRQIISDAKVPS